MTQSTLTGITRAFDEPFYSGASSAVSDAFVSKYDVVINGIGYLLDLDNPSGKTFEFNTIPLLAAAFLQDRSDQPIGEHSINSRDYWRRSVDDWSAGAGQKFLDHPESVANRFRTSKGCDPWTAGQLGMLNDTTLKTTSANTNLRLAVAGSDLYVLDGTAWKFTTSLSGTPSYTTLSGTALSGAVEMTTDGNNVWVVDSAKTYYTTRGAATYVNYHTANHVATYVKSAKGRLFTTNGRTIYTHSGAAGSAVATAYFTHPNSDWAWTAIEGGFDAVYFAGHSGNHSTIYAATIKSDGTALDVPIAVADLPVGEVVRSLKAYLNILIIGTDSGFRAAIVGGQQGQLTLGALVTSVTAPRCFEAQDRFVWFGWTNYDSTSTGLGRMDLSVFNNDVPAYASDLMATTQGTVLSVVTFGNVRVFMVSGHGLYSETTNKVATASITAGWLNYALADPKIALKFNVQHRAGAGSYVVSIASDDNTAAAIGNTITTNAVAGSSNDITVPQITGRALESSVAFARSGTDNTQGPILDRHTLMVEPAVNRRAMIQVPLRLHTQMRDRLGANIACKPAVERQRFYSLLQARTIVPYQDTETSWNVIVDDYEWLPYALLSTTDNPTWDGTLVVSLKIIA